MLGGLGLVGLVAIVVVLVGAAVLAVLVFRFGMFRRRKRRGSGKSGLLGESRIEVLERTRVDAERQLVLVRCDRVEHLILVGGPADVIVENDVKKVRGPGAPAPKTPALESGQSAAATLLGAASAGAGRAPAGERPPRVSLDTRPAAGARPAPMPLSGAPGRSAPATSADIGHSEGTREQKPPADSSFGRRESRPQQRRTIQPAPLGGARREAPQSPAGGNGRQEDALGLPSAGVPWSEPDSIENEIVRALRVDPLRRGGDNAPKPRPPVSAKVMSDPSTTLGDLADKLEEALAEEVQSASHGRRKPEFDPDTFAFDSGAGAGAETRNSSATGEPMSRASKKDMHPAPEPSAAPQEPERRREPAKSGERREEAPVISLSSRRRETADPLEDEMARLLGELTGDTKGR